MQFDPRLVVPKSQAFLSSASNRRIPAIAALVWAALLGNAALAHATPDVIDVHCRAFHDVDLDGAYDLDEPLLEDIRFTNGDGIFRTDAAGEVELAVDRAIYRFATMTIPAGWWPTSSYYKWVPVGMTGPVNADFGLRPRPETATDPIKWIHVADTQVYIWSDPWRFDIDLDEINQLPFDPLMIINTGDLVEVGSDTTNWNNYMQQTSVSDFQIFPVVGNHDTTGTPTPLNNYEQYVGPAYYSFEMGSYHFIVYNTEAAALGTPNQDVWLDQDTSEAPPGSHFLLFQHRMIKEIPSAIANHWAAIGIQAVFSGHWHTTQLTRQKNGIVDYNISRTRSGPLDHTPRSFAIVTCDENGGIDYELRRLAVNHRSDVMHPAPGETVFGGTLDIQFQAYDTSSKVSAISATVSGTGGSVGPVSLAPEGIFQWRASMPIDSLPDGNYTLTASGSYEDGQPFTKFVAFSRSSLAPPDPMIGDDWPMFRREPKGTSFTSTTLTPPLTLAWSRQVPGMVELSSPVVAGGRVFLGTRSENQMNQAGVSAFDAETGAPLWFTETPGGVALAPAVAEGIVVVTTMADSIFGLDAATGGKLWQKYKPSSRYDMTAPIIEGPKVWAGAEPKTYQMTVASGATDWISDTIGNDWFPYMYSAVAVGPTNLYFGTFGFANENYGGFRVVGRASGTMGLKLDGAYRSPIWADSILYVVGDPDRNSQKLTARDANGGLLWTASKFLGGGTGAPALGNGVLVVPGMDGRIEGFRASDGLALWTKTVGNVLLDVSNGVRGGKSTNATPAIADSVVYCGSADGKLYGLDLATGAQVWSWDFKIPVTSSAAISGNMLFVGASDGHLYAFTNGASHPSTGVPAGLGGFDLRFDAPRPNPFSGEASLAFNLSRGERVRLRIFDVRGRLVRTLADRRMEAGAHALAWDGVDRDGKRAAAGVYFARLDAAGQSHTRKMVRLEK